MPSLDERDLTFRVADARRTGWSRRRIDGHDYERPFRGLRALRSSPPDVDRHPIERQRAEIVRASLCFCVHMHPAEYFSHTTAAVLWDLPLPPLDDAMPHVSVAGRAPRMRGVHGHQISPALVRVVEHPTLGVRLADPASTWAMLGGMLPHPYDLVAVGDAIVREPRVPGPAGRVERAALATTGELDGAMRAGRRVGVGSLRETLPRIRPGAASRPESWLRLTLADAGLPDPVLDHDVYDGSGAFVGCVDLAYPGARVAIEYEGDQHRTDARQWQRDIEKHERLADLGWRVVRVPRDQLFRHPEIVVRRVRAALARA